MGGMRRILKWAEYLISLRIPEIMPIYGVKTEIRGFLK
jgi:hypothetical protein